MALAGFNPQQSYNRRVLQETKQGKQRVDVLLSQLVNGCYPKSPLVHFWVFKIPSPEAVCTKDAQSTWASHNGVLLPVLPCWTHFSVYYSQLLDPPITLEILMGSAASQFDGSTVHCAPVSTRALYSYGSDAQGR